MAKFILEKTKITLQNVDAIIAQAAGATEIDTTAAGFMMNASGTKALAKFLKAIPQVEILKFKLFMDKDHEDAFMTFLSNGAKNLQELHINQCGTQTNIFGSINRNSLPKLKAIYEEDYIEDSKLKEFAALNPGIIIADRKPKALENKVVEEGDVPRAWGAALPAYEDVMKAAAGVDAPAYEYVMGAACNIGCYEGILGDSSAAAASEG